MPQVLAAKNSMWCDKLFHLLLFSKALVSLAKNRESLNGHRWKMAPKRSTKSTPITFALFRLFSLVFNRFCTFSLLFALSGLSVSDRSWPSVFALFRTIRLLPFSGCHLDSPEKKRSHYVIDRSCWYLSVPTRSWDIIIPRLARLQRKFLVVTEQHTVHIGRNHYILNSGELLKCM